MRRPPQHPKLLTSELTGKVYVCTKYTDLGAGQFVSRVKYDVTKDFMAIHRVLQAKEAEEEDRL